MHNVVSISAFIFDLIVFIFAGNMDSFKILDGFEIRQNGPGSVGMSGKIPLGLKWEKCCDHSSAFIFGWILIMFTGNKENHKSLDEFEFLPDPITNY